MMEVILNCTFWYFKYWLGLGLHCGAQVAYLLVLKLSICNVFSPVIVYSIH